ncbi:outer membrane beta-barrel protein [Sediminibacterium soli]|uniref:outer membrane beta-barrel protein n=1 Tax=Sediminibacterium soli TaxID=2698829 RepID=UPI00137985C1|nr:outer membrane beta-barrel protein [Sediminibacterium soli]NCI47646.1 outer membrane beta-barrel protein [Sediminibacterium soli]
MYRIVALLLLINAPFFLQAQRTPASVKGVVFDSLSRRGLSYATISVVNAKDSTLITFARADSAGRFRIPSISEGKYLLSASYVGYVPVWKTIELTEGVELSLGNITMTDIVHSGDVTVIARRAPVTINNDTVEFNTENFKTQPNAVVEDLLKKLPGVTVDNDGAVRMNGQRINRVLVNGREFFTGDARMATKNLDADAVDKVQVFDKKSDRSEFTGVDDGQSEKAINLKLKKDRNNALFGRLTAGGGTNERYDGQTNLNKFRGDQQTSLIAMANNTNKQGFSISDVMNFTGELARGMRNGGGITIRTGGQDDLGLPVTGQGPGQPGVATTIAGGLNFNDLWNNKKTDFNASAMASDVDLRTDRSTNRRNVLPGNNFIYQSNSNSARKNDQQRFNVTLDHRFDSLTSLKFVPQITFQQSDSKSVSDYQSVDAKELKLSDGNTSSSSHSDAFNFGGNAQFRKRLARKGRTISSNLSLTYNDSKQNGMLYTRNTFYNAGIPLPDSVQNQRNSREAVTRSLGGNIIYTEPLGKRSLLEFSAFYNTSVGDSKRDTYDYNGSSGKHDRPNAKLSNDFKSGYNYTGGSISLRTNRKKMSFTFGSALQSASLYSTNNTNGNRIAQTFTDWLPNANIQYRMNQTRSLSVNYTTTTNQPSTYQLQPVADVSDPLNTYTGNPNLKRSYQHSVSLNYFSTNIYTQRNVFAFVALTKTNNAIVNSDVINANSSRSSSPVNVNGNYTVFSNINAGFPIRKLKSRVDAGIGSNLLHNISFVNGNRNEINNFSFSPNLSYNFSLDGKLDIMATARVNFSKIKYTLQPVLNTNYQQQVYGLDMTNYLPAGIVLNNTFNYTINTGRSAGFNTKAAYWNASLAKSFLKNNRGEIKFSAFDLLNQNIGISSSGNQNYIEDSRFNVLNRYFMLSFSFRINKANAEAPRVMIRTFGG